MLALVGQLKLRLAQPSARGARQPWQRRADVEIARRRRRGRRAVAAQTARLRRRKMKESNPMSNEKTAPARWAPTSYKWSYNPYKWPYKWVTGVITLLIEVRIPFITSRGPPCGCLGYIRDYVTTHLYGDYFISPL